jgi:hypothetical protein
MEQTMNNIPKHIDDLLVVVKEMGKAAGADQVAVRRTRAALETAKYCAAGILPTGNLSPLKTAVNGSFVAPETTPGKHPACICPDGAVDTTCPYHKNFAHGQGVA